MIRSLFSSLSDYKYYDDKEKRLIVQSLQKNKIVFRHTTTFRHRCFVAFSKVMGFKIGLYVASLIN